jgi:3-oxoacyl-[acyl-carrier protein] reductase
MNLNNKVAIVTGGSRDIGKAISLGLAAAGAKVVVNYLRNQQLADETVSEIKQAGGSAIAVSGDMTIAKDVENLIAKATETYGDSIDILVNNAGGLVERRTVGEMDQNFLEHIMTLNMTSAFLAIKAAVPFMKSGSSIINIASQAARDGGGPGASAYAASKGALVSYTRAMAKELGPSNIRVNCLCPGIIDTTFHDTFTKDEVREKLAAGTALRREGTAEEVASLVTYLASDEASFMAGASLDINGGIAFS